VQHIDDFRNDFEFRGWNTQPNVERRYELGADILARRRSYVVERFHYGLCNAREVNIQRILAASKRVPFHRALATQVQRTEIGECCRS
jgi:hypothetical protein